MTASSRQTLNQLTTLFAY